MLPFDRYPGNGRKLLGKPAQGDGTCRHSYGPPVFDQCGMSCAYCGRSLDSPYESWLDISIDHVIPRSAAWYSQCSEWIDDMANIVTCCRACNEFLNQYKVDSPPPNDLSEFFELRNRVFVEKREHACKRHREERDWYERWVRLKAEEKKNP